MTTFPAHETQTKRYRHLNIFQHECFLEVRVLPVKLPDGRVLLIEPDWAGKLAGFTLVFEALMLMLCQQMPFAALARLIGESWHRVHVFCSRYVDMAAEIGDGGNQGQQSNEPAVRTNILAAGKGQSILAPARFAGRVPSIPLPGQHAAAEVWTTAAALFLL